MFFDWNNNGKKDDFFDDAMDFMMFEELMEDEGRDGGKGGGKSEGCYIATCVYGSYDCPEVWTLRRFRDGVLRRSSAGRAFVRLYYAVSPAVVQHFGGIKVFRQFWRGVLDRLVIRLQAHGLDSTPYQD